ncbi:MAG TPA: ATP-binding protein, partial [Candidatus Limnocylindrales bacterium]|nr:ATP-binding protein [Candidatus Limnocylindrales bacterium]
GATGRRLTLEIRDDGVGFDPATVPLRPVAGGQQGLANLRRRAELLNAQLEIRSAPGQGTALSLTMPITGAP